jgi:hypothetical protein
MPTVIDGDTGVSQIQNGVIVQADLATGVAGTGPAFSAYNSSATSLSSGTATKIAFQTEVFDTNSCFDSTTNYRFTPTVAGYYQINGSVRSDSTCSYLGCYVRKTGSDVSGGSFVSTSTAVQQQVVSTLVYLNGSTDYVELFAFVVTTVNTNATQAGTYFNGCLVRAA